MIIKKDYPIIYDTQYKTLNVERNWWITYVSWNVYLNYDVPNSTTVTLIYNWSVAEESYKLKRPLYLPCNQGRVKIKIEIES